MLLCSSYSNAQKIDPAAEFSVTGNVLNLGGGLPWSGTVAGQAGGESGGPTPAYNSSTGNIIFSYSSRSVSQMVAINQALAAAGTGIQLGGYRYSWDINNDQNNYGGNRGTITGNVSLIGSGGNLLETYNYDYTKLNSPGFTRFSATQLFENRYSLASVSSLAVSFTGVSQNWWAGYYGPRVHVNEFSLLYTAAPPPPEVDPCVNNPLSSSKCPGYGSALSTKSTNNSVAASAPAAVITASTQDSTTGTPTVNAGGVQVSSTGGITAPDNIPQTIKDVQAVTQQSQSTANTTAAAQTTKSAPNMSLIMSVIGQIQANDRAGQTAAVQNANRTVAASAAAAQEQANAVVEAANAASAAAAQNQRSAVSSQGGYNSTVASAESSLTTNKSVSMNDLLQTKMNTETAANSTTTDTVNKNTQTNELAGNIDIANIAIQPRGFDVYATLIIKDADFYAPKDIYGNQKTIDNARALRLLSNDRLHQEMIDQQYRR